jgi:hypothetical protein
MTKETADILKEIVTAMYSSYRGEWCSKMRDRIDKEFERSNCKNCGGKGWYINEDHKKYPSVQQKLDCECVMPLPKQDVEAILDYWSENNKPPFTGG